MMRVPVGRPASAIIVGNKKLIYFYENNESRLYDLADDERERKQIDSKEIKADLASRLTRYLKEREATMVYNSGTGLITYPDGFVEQANR